ncbi:MAG: cytochrome c3 family protein [Armatimonadota bacterium]
MPDISGYTNSVHAKIIRKDRLVAAAVCTDCHGVHDIQAAAVPTSSANKAHVPATCGKCHAKIRSVYEKSVHGSALARGVKEAPVCTDCHGEHGIRPISAAASSVSSAHVVATCSKCHENALIQRKYGLPAHRLATYMASYHGIANKYGQTTVANCATCHGDHNILPSSNPQSPVNKANLPKTCGGCHPGASANFAVGTIHVFPTKDGDVIVYWVRLAYRVFVAGLIGSFCMYIALDLLARWRGRIPWHRRGTH